MTLEEAWDAYQLTLHQLECVRIVHDEAYKKSAVAYKLWLNKGGDPKQEPGYRERDTTGS
jgi:hypothetical protein